MSTRSKVKRILILVGSVGLLVILLMLLGVRSAESKSKLRRYWKVKELVINGTSVIDDYNLKSLSFLDQDRLLLPKSKEFQGALPLKYSTWQYRRRNFMNGLVIIEDLNQNIFDGTYEIEILDHREPKIIRLRSESIDIYLQATERFTLDNQTIEK